VRVVRFLLATILLAASFSGAGQILEDSARRFVLTDSVADPSPRACADDLLWIPEAAFFPGDPSQSAIPFRIYSLALPGAERPSVQIENVRSQDVEGKPCRLAEAFPGKSEMDSALSRGLSFSEPYLRDGLWRTDVRVPLLYQNSGRWVLRRAFRLVMTYQGQASGRKPGQRALHSVLNKSAATRFGDASDMALSKKSATAALDLASIEGTEWLAQISVGDRILATQQEDRWYAVSFSSLKDALRKAGGGREQALDGIPVGNVRLFGTSPDTLTEAMRNDLEPGLTEQPILIRDVQNNGIFDTGDTLLFLGWGTSLWKRVDLEDSTMAGSGMEYYFSSSPYTYRQVFLLGAGGAGARMETLPVVSGQGQAPDWKRYVRSEKDLYLRDAYFGLSSSTLEETTGKEWFWAWGQVDADVKVSASDISVAQLRTLPGLQGDSAWLGISMYPHRSTSSSNTKSMQSLSKRMEWVKVAPSFQGKSLGTSTRLLPGGTFVYAVGGALSNGNSISVDLPANSVQNDRFNGVSLAYRWDPLQTAGGEWLLPGSVGGRLRIAVPNGMSLVKFVDFKPIGFLPVQNGFAEDSIGSDNDTRYYVSRLDSLQPPVELKAVLPRSASVDDPLAVSSRTEYLIIAPEEFQTSALKLKAFREGGEAVRSFRTSVVLAEDIYRYYTGGAPTPVALRDYLRYARARCPDLRLVLLAGDGHYDYRGIRPSSPVNHLPPYEAEDMSTDDFFVALDAGEAVKYGSYALDLAIGRLPVNTVDEFEIYLKKVKEYEQTSIMDNDVWRNTVLLLADDAMQRDEVDGIQHTPQQERVSAMIDSNALARNFAVDVRKLYLLQYERDASYQKPEAARDLISRLNQGALFAFYFGHGSSTLWADEGLLKVNSIHELDNGPRYTILGSFACTVGRFDESQVTSLSEVFMKTSSKGAIASIGAMRETYPTPNEMLAKGILYNALFTTGMTLGEAIQKAKGTAVSSYSFDRYNNEKYVLLGEPVIGMPDASLGISLDQVYDTLQALQKVELSGKVSTGSGKLRVQVLEGTRSKVLAQDLGNGSTYSTTVLEPGNLIHSESMAMQNGSFSTQFVTPRKIAFGDTAAQIRIWAWSPGKVPVGRALLSRIAVAGTSSYADSLQDDVPPDIKIYPCVRSGTVAPYAEGQLVRLEIPACLEVAIEDSTGLDYREEADEGVSFEVAGHSDPWHPWPFLEQTGRRAVARMQFGSRYSSGQYTFQVMAQDILGNISYRSLAVELAAASRQGLADVYNVPNPMGKRGTTFYFKDLSGDRRSLVTIQIFDQNGKLVQVIRDAKSGMSRWDGRDFHGRLLANGLYHYVVQNAVFPSESGGRRQVFELKQKLVISR